MLQRSGILVTVRRSIARTSALVPSSWAYVTDQFCLTTATPMRLAMARCSTASVPARCFDRRSAFIPTVIPREMRQKSSSFTRFALFATVTGWTCIFGGSAGQALQYQRVPLNSPPAVLVLLRGPIIKGDYNRFVDFLRAMPATDRITALALDSPGGNLVEAETMAEAITRLDASIFVGKGNECSSACFLLFAAGSRRIVGSDALIRVHSVSENGEETIGSMAVTTAMARNLGGLGVPPAIIGKLVQTPPGRATWLTPSDLASMSVTVLDEASSAPSRSYASPSVNAPTQYYGSPSMTPPNEPASSRAYEQGLADRRAWEWWFGGLAGAFKDGAEYWAGERSNPQPGSCYGPAGQNLGDWTEGCLAAKRVLSPSDIRRKAEPEYRAGWRGYRG